MVAAVAVDGHKGGHVAEVVDGRRGERISGGHVARPGVRHVLREVDGVPAIRRQNYHGSAPTGEQVCE